MKKSTIFLVAVVYIVSFIIVGFFGISIKGYFEDIYVEEIRITCPEQGVTIRDATDYDDVDEAGHVRSYDFRTFFENKEGNGMEILLKAEVYPLNTSFKNVDVVYDEDQSSYKPRVEGSYIHVEIYKSSVSSFAVQSTDGKKYQVRVKIAAL